LLQKLLVPLDGSELGERALAYATELAVGLGSEVQLICVHLHHDDETRRMCDTYIGRIAERLRSSLNARNNNIRVHPVFVNGEPATRIINYADKEGISLIVLSSHGHSGIMPWAVGSTANKIIRISHKPVLLIRSMMPIAQKDGLFRKILLPLDGSQVGEAALPYVQEVASALGSEVVMLRVVESELKIHSIGAPDRILVPEQVIEEIRQAAKKYLDGEKRKFLSGAVRTLLKDGNIAYEILMVSEEEKVSIVAMSTHGLSGIERWMLGSISDKILQSGKTPFLLVPPKLSDKK